MHNILLDIVRKKKEDIQKINDIDSFKTAIVHPKYSDTAFIGEIKLASPTMKPIDSKMDIIKQAIEYENAGLDAISAITEKHFFKGDPLFIPKIKKKIKLPILQKDFVIDESQIYEAKQIGSDALLLIARLVDEQTLIRFVSLCQKLGIEPVVEIQNDEDLYKAVATNTSIIAVNARNLETFEINVDSACKLIKKIPERFMKLGFSGIQSSKEVKKYNSSGVKGVLIGTSLMKSKNILKFIHSLKKA
ncbi:indole-3-glycerol-phosphate synthase [Candidatus Roizmanbacteria bacterium]|nr:indole-3-glycerol-phosphate synthase [Candidatus Roizmanbacteria bacterium]